MLLTSESIMPSLAATISPLLLPSAILIAHSYAATSSLKTWYTVRNLQDAPPPATEEEEKNDKRRLRRKKIAGIVIACAFLVAEFWIAAQGTEKHIAYLLQGLVGGTLFAAHFTTLSKLLGSKWVVARRRSGHLSFSLNKPTKWAKAATAGLVLVACSNCYITLTQPENTPMRLLSIAAIVVSLTSRCTAKKTGVRKMTIFFMTYEAIVLFLTVVLIVPSYKSTSFNDLFASVPSDVDTSTSPLAPLVNQLSGILVPAFYTAPVGQYLSLLLRFDHSQSSTTLSSSSPQLSLESVSAPIKGCRRTNGPGLVIPFSTSSTSILPKSSRTYYSLGLSITSFIYLFIAPLLHKAMQIYVFPALASTEYAFLEDQIFAILAMFITMPVLVCVMGVYAKTRGEGKTFWRYEESWVKDDKKEQGAVQLAADALEKQPLVFAERDNAIFPEDKKAPLEV